MGSTRLLYRIASLAYLLFAGPGACDPKMSLLTNYVATHVDTFVQREVCHLRSSFLICSFFIPRTIEAQMHESIT